MEIVRCHRQVTAAAAAAGGGGTGAPPTYKAAPQLEVRLEEFELFAIDRLRVLKGISDGLSRGKRPEEMEKLEIGWANWPVAAYETGWANWAVAVYVYKSSMARFADLGRSTKASPEEVAKDVEILIIMVANESEADSVLFLDMLVLYQRDSEQVTEFVRSNPTALQS